MFRNFNVFCFMATVFELQAILRQLHGMPPNDLEHKRSKVTLVPTSPNFQSISFYGQFSSHRLFWDKYTEWPKKTLKTKWSKATHNYMFYKCPKLCSAVSMIGLFPYNQNFVFPQRVQWWIWNFAKEIDLKLRTHHFKIQNSSLVMTIEKKIQEKVL